MRCPRCDGNALFEEYALSEGKWVRKIYCPICYHREVMEVTGEEPLEDKVEFQLQGYYKRIKKNIIACFEDGKEYYSGLTIIDKDGNKVRVDISIKPTD